MSTKKQFIKVLTDYDKRIINLLCEMRKIYGVVEHISKDIELLVETLKKEEYGSNN